MRRGIAALAVCLILGGCAPAPAPAPVPAAPVPVVHVEEDPAETGMCKGKYIRVEVPAVPEGTPDPDEFLRSYYETYTRAYCAEIAALQTLWV